NPELSNKPFSVKRWQFASSNLAMNRSISNSSSWTADEILSRGETLAALALRIWPYFGPRKPERFLQPDSHVTGTTPKAVLLDGFRHEVESWRDVASITLEYIASLVVALLARVDGLMPLFVSAECDRFRSSRKLTNGWCFETNLSSSAITRNCFRAVEIAGIDAARWQVSVSE
ncbi:MAG: DUF1524 domain-containing protein, partial [Chloroflexota bacterium]